MIVRGATTVVAVWAVLAVPSLCMGGIIAHPSDCGTAAECGHDGACGNDPCDEMTARDESQSVHVDLAVSAPAADSLFLAVDQGILAEQARELACTFLLRANLPCHASDAPLLI